jgi:hypothetical protein
MEARLIRRPAIDFISGRSQHLLSLNVSARRHESSYRRTVKKLNVRPHPSFQATGESSQKDQIIFNPPSSAPSVLHTPLKFLPKEDKRRQLLAATATTPSRLPPPVSPKSLKLARHHLTEAQISEMRKLRLDSPDKWPNKALARKYNCSSLFVTMCLKELPGDGGPAEEARKTRVQTKLEAVKERWGPTRRMAREDRAKRIELALRDA